MGWWSDIGEVAGLIGVTTGEEMRDRGRWLESKRRSREQQGNNDLRESSQRREL